MKRDRPGGLCAPSKRRAAFSLVETLVVVGIAGVLFAIIFPVLASARANAGQTSSLVRAREIAMTIDAFAQAHSGAYPALRAHTSYPVGIPTREHWLYQSFLDEAGARWRTREWWVWAIAAFASPAEHWQAWVSPGSDTTLESFDGGDYRFSNSFVAAPRLWTPEFMDAPDARAEVLRDVRQHEVRSPSAKAMVWDGTMAYLPAAARRPGGAGAQPMPIAFADLHAAAHRYNDAVPAFANPLNSESWRDTRLHNTPAGVEGTDY